MSGRVLCHKQILSNEVLMFSPGHRSITLAMSNTIASHYTLVTQDPVDTTTVKILAGAHKTQCTK